MNTLGVVCIRAAPAAAAACAPVVPPCTGAAADVPASSAGAPEVPAAAAVNPAACGRDGCPCPCPCCCCSLPRVHATDCCCSTSLS